MENEKKLLEEAEKSYNIRHRCFHFAKDLVNFVNECSYDRIHFSLFDQLLRSGTSIGANIVEGSSGSTKKDFINYLHVALKSANESKYWICLIRDVLEVDRDKINILLQECNEISKIIASIIVNSKK